MTGASCGTVSEAGTGTASTTPVATLAAYERSGHKRADGPFSHTSCKRYPLYTRPGYAQPVNSGYTACSGTTWPHALPATPPTSARLARVCNVGPVPISPQGRGDIGLEFDSNSSSPGLDTFTFKEFRLLVAGHFPKTPQCPHNNLFRHVQREVDDCHPHRTVIRCDLQSLNSLQHMDASDAGSLRGKPYIKTIHTPERFTLSASTSPGTFKPTERKTEKLVRGRP
ncbi:hypothetical protein BSL78_17159 [Apostichopus japonicus]|uniref:Uncharacterized protein n=1 Tax=Stichopus japonicus TaxID=307972 RepID=A0A2G8KD81_STIJA|nr:hypothetical protein BSL78_17159 [Apostichopus japonicus]